MNFKKNDILWFGIPFLTLFILTFLASTNIGLASGTMTYIGYSIFIIAPILILILFGRVIYKIVTGFKLMFNLSKEMFKHQNNLDKKIIEKQEYKFK